MSNFFDRPQKKITFSEYQAKSPLFYPKVKLMGAIFAAPSNAIKALLPEGPYDPIQMLPGVGVASVHCMEYLESDIGPYNEIALTLGMKRQGESGIIPLRTLLSGVRSEFHGFVADLPVNTPIAYAGGVEVFNFPKHLEDIEFTETETVRTCTLREKKTGDVILRFEGQKLKPSLFSPKKMTLHTYPLKNGEILHAKNTLNLNGCGMSFSNKRVSLELMDHPLSQMYRSLKFFRTLQIIYCDQAQAILFEPEKAEVQAYA